VTGTGPPVVATPLRTEYAAVRSSVPGLRVERTGRGPGRSAGWAAGRAAGPVLVAGVAGALTDELRPGDLVVAGEVTDGTTTVRCPAAPLLAGALARRGLTAVLGRLATWPTVVSGITRDRLAGTGALAVDTETLPLAAAAGKGPFAAVRAVVDTPHDPLLHPATIGHGLRALRSLRAAAPVLAEWAAALGPRELAPAGPGCCSGGATRPVQGAPAAGPDLVLVAGSADAPAVRLVEDAERAGCPAHLIQDAGAVDLRWLAGAIRIRLTAAIPLPPHLVEDLVTCLSGLGPVTVRAGHGGGEHGGGEHEADAYLDDSSAVPRR
jgi:4-hydroxy-3-methylbut-2-enyl diphosphate reductase